MIKGVLGLFLFMVLVVISGCFHSTDVVVDDVLDMEDRNDDVEGITVVNEKQLEIKEMSFDSCNPIDIYQNEVWYKKLQKNI